MMEGVTRTEVIKVGKEQSLSNLCHQVKILFSRTNYIYKQKNKIYLSYYELDKLLKTEECCKVLPVYTAQHTLKLLMRNWKAFYKVRREIIALPI